MATKEEMRAGFSQMESKMATKEETKSMKEEMRAGFSQMEIKMESGFIKNKIEILERVDYKLEKVKEELWEKSKNDKEELKENAKNNKEEIKEDIKNNKEETKEIKKDQLKLKEMLMDLWKTKKKIMITFGLRFASATLGISAGVSLITILIYHISIS